MEALNILYTGDGTTSLSTASFNGTSWSGGTTILSQLGHVDARSATAPGAAILNNRLYIVYREVNTSNLCCAWNDGIRWDGGIPIKSMPGGLLLASDTSPNIAVYNGWLYVPYIPPGPSDGSIYLAWYDGTQWHGGQKIASLPGGINPKASANPAIQSWGGNLCLVYLDASSKNLFISYYNLDNWHGNRAISSMPGGIFPQSSQTPNMCVYHDNLYLVYLGNSTNTLYTCLYNGSVWSGNTPISEQPGDISPVSASTPGIEVDADGKLYLVYVGVAQDSSLYSCSFDGSNWSGNTRISSQPGSLNLHSSSSPQVNLTANIPASHAQWLSKLADNILLSEINLPGSHDAAAISRSSVTLYGCHYYSISEQLEYGIRLLDVRVKVVRDGTSLEFFTCHGKILSNQYQSLKSLLDECQKFLTTNAKETIVVIWWIEDWTVTGGEKTHVYAELLTLLKRYPILTQGDIPSLGEARGKLVLFTRDRHMDNLSFGTPLGSYPDNTEGSFLDDMGGRGYEVYLQDKYNDLPLLGTAVAKTALVTAAFTKKTPGMVVLNFASATQKGIFGVYVMPNLMGFFGENPASQRPAIFGWTFFDYGLSDYGTNIYGSLNIVSLIIASNFGYAGYENKFTLPVLEPKEI